MNQFICFLLVFAFSYRSGTACKSNIIEISNQLGPGIVLQYQCPNDEGFDVGIRELGFNEVHFITFKEWAPLNLKRIQYRCKLRYDNFFHDLEVYRSAFKKRCGQRRLWTAKKDGIYFRRGYDKPSEFERRWNVVP